MVAGFALPDGWPIAMVAVCLFSTVLIVRRDRRRDGFFVNGDRRGRTLPVIIALLVVSLAALHLAIFLRMQEGVAWAPVAGGVTLAFIATAASFL